MSELESLISRYFDGELSPDEVNYLHKVLTESPEAYALYKELHSISRAAREIPNSYIPSGAVQSELFERLTSEGLYAPHVSPEPVVQKEPAPLFTQRYMSGIRKASLAFAVILVGVLGFNLFQLIDNGASSTSSPSVADASIYRPQQMEAAPVEQLQITKVPEATENHGLQGRHNIADIPLHSGRTSRAHRDTEAQDIASSAFADNTQEDSPQAIRITQDEPVTESTINEEPQSLVVQSSSDNIAAISDDEFATQDNLSEQQRSLIPSTLPESNGSTRGMFAASVRPGFSYVDEGAGLTADELSISFDARLGEEHRVSLIVGKSPLLTERRTTRITSTAQASPGSDPAKNGTAPTTASWKPVISTEHQLDDEIWGGIGYGYEVLPGEAVQVETGVRAGVGADSWRIGAELPVSMNVTDMIVLALIPSATHIIPHNQSVSDFDNNYPTDEDLKVGIQRRPTFTTFSLEVGFSVNLILDR